MAGLYLASRVALAKVPSLDVVLYMEVKTLAAIHTNM